MHLGWLLLTSLVVFITYSDIRYRLIPNVSVIVVFTISLLLSQIEINIAWAVKSLSLALFFITLSILSIWGAGDAKLSIVFMPLISEEFLLLYLLGFIFIGGFLAVAYLMVGLLTSFEGIKKRGLPYGVPIAMSGLFFSIASV
ncbi:prepilin peptidase [Vibrio fluminensis]|uniref:prepilin peptidase n=1 Tax=Vibrio fluminensis TaxID=2783614 RepID=UPI001E3ED562|nr:prepilin peptidase [Vibrio fluminensis]